MSNGISRWARNVVANSDRQTVVRKLKEDFNELNEKFSVALDQGFKLMAEIGRINALLDNVRKIADEKSARCDELETVVESEKLVNSTLRAELSTTQMYTEQLIHQMQSERKTAGATVEAYNERFSQFVQKNAELVNTVAQQKTTIRKQASEIEELKKANVAMESTMNRMIQEKLNPPDETRLDVLPWMSHEENTMNIEVAILDVRMKALYELIGDLKMAEISAGTSKEMTELADTSKHLIDVWSSSIAKFCRMTRDISDKVQHLAAKTENPRKPKDFACEIAEVRSEVGHQNSDESDEDPSEYQQSDDGSSITGSEMSSHPVSSDDDYDEFEKITIG